MIELIGGNQSNQWSKAFYYKKEIMVVFGISVKKTAKIAVKITQQIRG